MLHFVCVCVWLCDKPYTPAHSKSTTKQWSSGSQHHQRMRERIVCEPNQTNWSVLSFPLLQCEHGCCCLLPAACCWCYSCWMRVHLSFLTASNVNSARCYSTAHFTTPNKVRVWHTHAVDTRRPNVRANHWKWSSTLGDTQMTNRHT